jgi:multiple sugar transport system permease protein
LYLPLLLLLIFVATPFLWALATSLKRGGDVMTGMVRYLPNPPTLENYGYVWTKNHFITYFNNSLFVAVISVLFVLLFSLLNAYALSRFEFKGKKLFMLLILATQFIPGVMIIIPQFIIFKNIGLINTPYALIITTIAGSIPFQTLLMKGFIDNVPVQVDEAAMVDGATRVRILATLIPPVILPCMVAIASFAFINSWNDFLHAFSFITDQNNFTIPVGLRYMIGEYSIDFASLSAGSLIALIPPLILFAYVQKYLISGLGSGAVKG